ncbi:MAG TPA: DUF2332 domain-containing protein [Nocardioidaceae bacterium]|nr:DUF2332 domain-containing protein [Nocardioidaceae bacterium]
MEMAEAFRRQAEACRRLESPMYAVLVGRVADDIAAGGLSREVLAGHEDDPGPSALALRMMGSVHRLVLSRRAGELAAYYPSVGGSWEPEGGWAAFRALLAEQPQAVREWLDRAPQTNEVGRSGALMGGLLRIGEEHAHPLRLFEMGSSGGLNLRVDRYAYTDDAGGVFGDPDSPVRLEGAWQGRPLRAWPELQIVERVGCDVNPVDVTQAEGRLTLTAYVWPDQTARLERLRGALQVAARVGAEVRRTDAVSFVRSLELADKTITVLWHSVMWQYLSREDQAAVSARIEELGSAATAEHPFAHLMLEPLRRTPEAVHSFLVALRLWPGGERRILGEGAAHGIPTIWE